jgi:hypothetical protein
MRNLSKSHIIVDANDRRHYMVISHSALSDDEASSAVARKSLHRLLRTGPLPGYVGIFDFIEVNAGDGWRDAP